MAGPGASTVLPTPPPLPNLADMGTVNLTLPDALEDFVDEQVAARGFASSGDYLRDLIRREKERAALRDLLLAGAASAPTAPADDAWFDEFRERVCRRAAV